MPRLALLVTLLAASPALAGDVPIVLMEGHAAQYAEAVKAIRAELARSQLLQVGAKETAAALAEAPLVIAVGNGALEEAKAHTRAPIVFSMVLGISKDALTPLITGVPIEPDPDAVFKRVKGLSPNFRRVGMLVHPRYTELIARAEKAAAAQKLELVLAPVSSAGEVPGAFETLSSRADVVWVTPEPRVFAADSIAKLFQASRQKRMPLIGFFNSFSRADALASISPSYTEIGTLTGKLASAALARPPGAPLPSARFAPGQLTLNAAVAKELGMSFSPELSRQAIYIYR